MAATAWAVFNIAKEKLADGGFDLDTQTFKMALLTDAQAIAATFAGTSTDCRFADLTAEVSGTGYTGGGKTLTATWTRSGGTITFDCDDQAWTASTFSAQYAVIYADNANDDLLCFSDLNSGGAMLSVVADTFTVAINAAGVFTLA
jgi:hypothetical protein